MIPLRARATGLPWEIWESPARLATLDPTDIVLQQSSHCLDGCRYDRSNAGAESGNAYPERWLYSEGDEAIVFDERGPGAITRVWMTTGFGTATCIDPAVRVRFYVDGATVPTLDVALAAVFDGSIAPFTAPLVADRVQSSGGYVSYVPIAYAQSLRIALVGAGNGGVNPCQPNGADPAKRLLWFQIQHHRITPGSLVTPFTPGHDAPAWRAFLAHAGGDPWNAMLAPESENSTIAPGAKLTLATRAGPGWLRGIRLHLPRAAYSHVNLRLAFDGVDSVDVPLADFFATAPASAMPARGVLVGEDAGGWLYAWIPMPFAHAVDVSLVAAADLPATIPVASALSFDTQPVSDDVGRYAATLSDTCVDAGRIALASADGAGKVIGVSARYDANGSGTRGYLEGDELASIDGAIAPAWIGTGVEDFYNGGFYFDQGSWTAALSGATETDPDGQGTTAVYRWMLTDPLVYSNGLRLDQEAGYAPAQPSPICARTVAHTYRSAQPSIVTYDAFEVGDAAAAAAHAYAAPPSADCDVVTSIFEDEPPTSRTALVCRHVDGSSHFHLRVPPDGHALRLRRTFDAGAGTPGVIAGSAAADIRINGSLAGSFPPVIANPARRWQQQDALLDVAAGTTELDVEIEPAFGGSMPAFSESRWTLYGTWVDRLFADGFEPDF
ncbi:MAG: DUF2961 domain-containing protein [Dokdonella sp.]|uniref:DUF2961 domain-containing protein n=1 Tax=Dokdonella sp. TaxID=2291710 RepID=UPI003267882B